MLQNVSDVRSGASLLSIKKGLWKHSVQWVTCFAFLYGGQSHHMSVHERTKRLHCSIETAHRLSCQCSRAVIEVWNGKEVSVELIWLWEAMNGHVIFDLLLYVIPSFYFSCWLFQLFQHSIINSSLVWIVFGTKKCFKGTFCRATNANL